MALLSRLFPNRKCTRNLPFTRTPGDQKKPWIRPTFNKSDIRLVIFQDHEVKGKRLWFDSKEHAVASTGTTQHAGKKKNPSGRPADMANSVKLEQKCKQRQSDIEILGEMMFGSVAMSYKGSTLKVHSIRSPSQLMVTKVFVPSPPRESAGEQETFDSCSIQSTSSEGTAPKHISGFERSGYSVAHSVPVDVPSPPKKEADIDQLLENEDSGISASVASSNSSFTPYHSPGSSSASINSNSYNSLHRRFLRSKHMSLEYLKSRHSDELHSNEPAPTSKRAPRFGIGIIFSLPEEDEVSAMHFQQFFFSHITLIEGHIQKLRAATEKALLVCTRNRQKFTASVLEALNVFGDAVQDLYTAPRLPDPVWLNMMCYSTHRVKLCQRFLKEFMTVVEKYDTKNTKFFVSTLLTAVLTHHLAWVPTVTPAGAHPARTYMDKHSARWLDALAKSHPYNPLWAQLGDLYGAIGFPLRHSRTVLIGKRTDAINKLLYILSYFIRCSEVAEHSEIPALFMEETSPVADMTPIVENRDVEARFKPEPELACSDSESGVTVCGVASSKSTFYVDLTHEVVVEPQELKVQYSKKTAESLSSCDACVTLATENANVPCDNTKNPPSIDQSRPVEQGSPSHPGAWPVLFFRSLDHAAKMEDGSVECSPNMGKASGIHNALIGNEVDTSQRDCGDGYDSFENSTDSALQNAERCDWEWTLQSQLSPLSPQESPRRMQVRNVGRLAFCDTPQTLPALPEGSNDFPAPLSVRVLSDEAESSESCSCRSPFSNQPQPLIKQPSSPMYSSQGSNESHVSDRTLTGDQSSPTTPVIKKSSTCDTSAEQTCEEFTHDSGIYFMDPSPACKTDSDQPTSKLDMKISYSRNSSMFDEYFNDDTIPVLPESQTSTVHLKRQASIEGNNSILDKFRDGSINRPSEMHLENQQLELHPKPGGMTLFETASHRGDSSFICGQHVSHPALSTEHLLHSCLEMHPEPKQRPDSLSLRPRTGSGASLLGRQNSNRSGGRCRSQTPTDAGRGRHMSSASVDSVDPFLNLNEVPMPGWESLEEPDNLLEYSQHFGRSLLAGHSDHYLSDFVLHGTNDNSYIGKLHSDLSSSVQNSVLDESIAESACIVADTDNWTVRLLSCQYYSADRIITQELMASQLVCNMVEAVHQLGKLKMSPEFCLMHLEDRLQEIYFKSKMLSEYLRTHKKIDNSELASLLGFDESDLPLLLAVAGTHTAHLAMGLQ